MYTINEVPVGPDQTRRWGETCRGVVPKDGGSLLDVTPSPLPLLEFLGEARRLRRDLTLVRGSRNKTDTEAVDHI